MKRFLWWKGGGGGTYFWPCFRYKHGDVCFRCNLLKNDDPVIWRTRRPAELWTQGTSQETDFLKNSVIIRTGHPEISRPARFRIQSRIPETHHDTWTWWDVTATAAMTAPSRRTFPNSDEWRMEKRNKERSNHFRDYSTKMENKWSEEHTHTKTDSLHMTLEDTNICILKCRKYSIVYWMHMWTKDVHIDKRDRTHKMHTRTLCLLSDVFAHLAFGYVCTVIMFSTFRKYHLLLWFSSAPPTCMSFSQIWEKSLW